jgi:uncharacterized glyoxalase superfamily protein PhnB
MKTSDPNASPPVSAPDYGRSLRGLGFNLIVRDVPRAVKFAVDVLGATAFYANDRFAAMKLNGGDFMFHHDDTYKGNPLSGIVKGVEARGIGLNSGFTAAIPMVEANAKAGGWTVLSGALDKPHGLRECMIIDDEGYVWIPSVHLP